MIVLSAKVVLRVPKLVKLFVIISTTVKFNVLMFLVTSPLVSPVPIPSIVLLMLSMLL